MKKFIITLVLAALPALMTAQTAFDKFDGKDDIAVVVVNQKLFDILKNMDITANIKDTEVKELLKSAEKLNNLRVYSTSNKKHAKDMASTVTSYLKSNTMEELIRVSDEGKDVKVYAKTNAATSQFDEVLVFVNGGRKDETVLVSLTSTL